MKKELIRWRAALSSLTEGKGIGNEECLFYTRHEYRHTQDIFQQYVQFNLKKSLLFDSRKTTLAPTKIQKLKCKIRATIKIGNTIECKT